MLVVRNVLDALWSPFDCPKLSAYQLHLEVRCVYCSHLPYSKEHVCPAGIYQQGVCLNGR